jgi:MoaA/NifB/PqqE/SkfB family radical SAM enzyme
MEVLTANINNPSIITNKSINNFQSDNLPTYITGWKQSAIKFRIWLSVYALALQQYKNPFTAINKLRLLLKMRNQYRTDHTLQKYVKVNGLIYYNYNAPGWPSASFNRYIVHMFKKLDHQPSSSLHTLVFAITKKCGFICEHCCEWEVLNKPETLGREDLLNIISKFYQKGISQVQISGGEPLNRLEDVIYLLDNTSHDINYWLYTTGYNLSFERAARLKEHGLTGITISLDHYDAVMHDLFRGKPGAFNRAVEAIHHAVNNKLIVTLSLCATRSFITKDNLLNYAEFAKNNGVSFIQVLEPKAVGHYAGKDVLLQKQHIEVLESFYEQMNYERTYDSYPIVTYHGYYTRRIGCAGSGKDYLYVDTDGDVHNCPFCQRKLFSALHADIDAGLNRMREEGCGVLKPIQNS